MGDAFTPFAIGFGVLGLVAAIFVGIGLALPPERRDGWLAAGLILAGSALSAAFLLLPAISGAGIGGFLGQAADGTRSRAWILLGAAPLAGPGAFIAGVWLLIGKPENGPQRRTESRAKPAAERPGTPIAPSNVVDVRRVRDADARSPRGPRQGRQRP